MGVRRTCVAVAVLLMTAGVASAQVAFAPRPEKNPYRNLFGERAPLPKPTPPPKPLVVCDLDPRMRLTPPAGVAHTMRRFVPPACRPE